MTLSSIPDAATMFALSPRAAAASCPEMAALVDAVDGWLLDRSGPAAFRRRRGDTSGGTARELFDALGSLGLAGAFVPQSCGGSGLPLALGPLLADRFGWHLAREPLIENCLLPAALLCGLAHGDRRDGLLADMARGTSYAVAFQEGPFQSNPGAALETTIQQADGRLRLTGQKRHVMGAVGADRLLVLANLDGSPCVASVASHAPGVLVEPVVVADGSCWSTVRLDAELTEADVIVEDGSAAAAIATALDWTNLAIAGLLYGLQCKMLQMTLEYLRMRQQFDVPIGSFQALQHRATDLYCANQITRFLLTEAIDTLLSQSDAHASGSGDRAPRLAGFASRCKARAADATLAVGKEAIQMHGAIGFSDEYDLGMYMNRALVHSAWLGNAAAHRRRYASLAITLVE